MNSKCVNEMAAVLYELLPGLFPDRLTKTT